MAERKTAIVDDWKDVPADDWKDVAPSAPAAAQEKPWIGTPPPENEGMLSSIFHAPAYGVQDIGAGVKHIMTPGKRMQGAHEVISGAGRAALPLVAPAIAAYGAPAVATGMVGGAIGSGLASTGAQILGANEDVSNLAGDVGGIVGGGVGGSRPGQAAIRGAGARVIPETTSLLKNWSFFHPLKMIPDVLNSAREVYRGGVQGMKDFNYSQTPKTANAVPPVAPPPPQEFKPVATPLPSGRSGPAPVQPEAPKVGRVVAPIQRPSPQEFTPIRTPLRSGRTVGGFANQSAPEVPVNAAPPGNLKMYQKVARQNFKADYEDLPSKVQETIRRGVDQTPAIATPKAKTPGTIEVPEKGAAEVVERVEHPPFAKNKPFSPSRAARQQAPQPTSKEKPMTLGQRLKANHEAMEAAKKLKEAGD